MWLPVAWMLAFQVPDMPGPQPRPPEPCADHVVRQRAVWHVTGPPRRQPPALDGSAVWHWPTEALGTWVVESRAPLDAVVSPQRVAPSGVTKVVWSARCRSTMSTRMRPELEGPRFTDADLQRLVDDHPQGLIYIWSPHLPLSLEGIAVIRGVAARRGLPLTVLVAPGANRQMVEATADARAWSEPDTRVVDSIELTFRDALVHAPSLQAFANGRLVGSPYPGYHSADEYGAYLDRVLAQTP